MWRRVLVFLLGILLVTGCGGARASVDELEGQLLVWHNWTPGPEEETLRGIIEGFSEIHPNVTVVTEYVASEELEARYLDQAAAGLGPDVIVGVETLYLRRFVEAGRLLPLDAASVAVNSLAPASLKALEWDNQLYGIPFTAYTHVLYYNRDVTITPPDTLTALQDAAQPDAKVGLPTDFYNAAWGIGAFDGTIVDADGNLIVDQGAVSAWLQWLVDAQRNPAIFLSNDSDQLAQLFMQGELAYFVGSSFELPYLQAALGAEAVGMVHLPQHEAQAATPFLEMEAVAVNRASAEVPLAMELITYLTNPTQQRRLALSDLGRAPLSTRLGVTALRVNDHAVELVRQRDTAVVVPLRTEEAVEQLRQNADLLFAQVLEGVLTPSEAAARLGELVSAGGQP